MLIGPLGTKFNETFIEIHTFSFKKIHLKMSSGKWRPFCLDLKVIKSESGSPLFLMCSLCSLFPFDHYSDVIMDTVASQITSLTIVYSTVYSDADQRKHESSASLSLVYRGPLNSPHTWPVTRKMFPFDVVIMRGTQGFVYTCVHR